jgi:hypothetical protein
MLTCSFDSVDGPEEKRLFRTPLSSDGTKQVIHLTSNGGHSLGSATPFRSARLLARFLLAQVHLFHEPTSTSHSLGLSQWTSSRISPRVCLLIFRSTLQPCSFSSAASAPLDPIASIRACATQTSSFVSTLAIETESVLLTSVDRFRWLLLRLGRGNDQRVEIGAPAIQCMTRPTVSSTGSNFVDRTDRSQSANFDLS